MKKVKRDPIADAVLRGARSIMQDAVHYREDEEEGKAAAAERDALLLFTFAAQLQADANDGE